MFPDLVDESQVNGLEAFLTELEPVSELSNLSQFPIIDSGRECVTNNFPSSLISPSHPLPFPLSFPLHETSLSTITRCPSSNTTKGTVVPSIKDQTLMFSLSSPSQDLRQLVISILTVYERSPKDQIEVFLQKSITLPNKIPTKSIQNLY